MWLKGQLLSFCIQKEGSNLDANVQKSAVLALLNTRIMVFGIASDQVLFESSLYAFPLDV